MVFSGEGHSVNIFCRDAEMSLLKPWRVSYFYYSGGTRISVDHDSSFPISSSGTESYADHDSEFPIEATAVTIDHCSEFPIVEDDDFTN